MNNKKVEIPTKNYAKIRIECVDNFPDLAHHFYNSRLLNLFKKLLKKRGIHYTYYRNGSFVTNRPVLIVDQFHLVIIAESDGRFFAYNKSCFLNLKFSFEASSNLEIIAKLLKFKIIGIGAAKQIGDIK